MQKNTHEPRFLFFSRLSIFGKMLRKKEDSPVTRILHTARGCTTTRRAKIMPKSEKRKLFYPFPFSVGWSHLSIFPFFFFFRRFPRLWLSRTSKAEEEKEPPRDSPFEGKSGKTSSFLLYFRRHEKWQSLRNQTS